eukprot:jgi/Antlo1/1482/1857
MDHEKGIGDSLEHRCCLYSRRPDRPTPSHGATPTLAALFSHRFSKQPSQRKLQMGTCDQNIHGGSVENVLDEFYRKLTLSYVIRKLAYEINRSIRRLGERSMQKRKTSST